MVWYWVLRKGGVNHDISTSFHRLLAVPLRSMHRVMISPRQFERSPDAVQAGRRRELDATPHILSSKSNLQAEGLR